MESIEQFGCQIDHPVGNFHTFEMEKTFKYSIASKIQTRRDFETCKNLIVSTNHPHTQLHRFRVFRTENLNIFTKSAETMWKRNVRFESRLLAQSCQVKNTTFNSLTLCCLLSLWRASKASVFSVRFFSHFYFEFLKSCWREWAK